MPRPNSFESLSGRAFSACFRSESSTHPVSRAPCALERCSGQVLVESSTASPVIGWRGSLLRPGQEPSGFEITAAEIGGRCTPPMVFSGPEREDEAAEAHLGFWTSS